MSPNELSPAAPVSPPAAHGDRTPRIAIIGAGMAGISCAQALKQAGLSPTLFEKSRGVGGRLSTRRNEAGESYDHGAQYITSRTPAFTQWLDARRGDDSAAAWEPQLDDASKQGHHPWIVGKPTMNALLKPPSGQLDVRTRMAIKALQREGDHWRLLTDDGPLAEPFDVVISTIPCPQARALLAVEPALRSQLDGVTMAPCWALMIRFSQPLRVDFDARRFEHGAIGWLARQASRPGHTGGSNAWVVHAGADWSSAHLELEPADAAALLQLDLARVIGEALPDVEFAQAHRWRYALTTQPLGKACLANADTSLFVAGDWCLGARVESAYESGVAAAQAVVKAQQPAT